MGSWLSFISMVTPTVYTNPSRNWTELLENALQTREIWKRRLFVLVLVTEGYFDNYNTRGNKASSHINDNGKNQDHGYI